MPCLLIKQKRACVTVPDPSQIYGVILQGTGLLLVVMKPQARRQASSPRQLVFFGAEISALAVLPVALPGTPRSREPPAPVPVGMGPWEQPPPLGAPPAPGGTGKCRGGAAGPWAIGAASLPVLGGAIALSERFALLFIPAVFQYK